jgi:predicted nucleic acid-binding protein
MSDHEWVIDTNILYKASDFDLLAQHFLTTVATGTRVEHKVAVDFEGNIQREYERCFNRTKAINQFPQKWWKRIKDSSKLTFHSGKLPKKHKDGLLQRLGFDNDDLPFVGVASKTKGKLLVAEESGYTPQVREYLKNDLRVQVMSIEEADSHAS